MKNEDEMLNALEPVPVKRSEPTYKSQSKAFSEGLTEERDMEIKESLLAMSIRFLKHGKKWTVQRFGSDASVEHILISTQPVKGANFNYHPPLSNKHESS